LLLACLALSAAAEDRFVEETLPGTEVRYTLALPEGHAPGASAPLVVSLHYGGPVSPWYGRALLESVVEPALRPLGALMVAPDCPRPAWSECGDMVTELIAHLRERYRMHDGCVVLTGYSKGGIGTWALASRSPVSFAAAVVMAAAVPEEVDLSQWVLPLRVIHGAADELFAASAAVSAVERLRAAGVDASIRVLDGVGHYETHRFAAPLAGELGWLHTRCAR
jgi:predicted peptidase